MIREQRIASEPEALIAWFRGLGFGLERIGLEAGPMSQWLHAAMRAAGLAVELLETRHVRDAFKAMPVKSDRNDARGIAQLMRLGWFRPVPGREGRSEILPRRLDGQGGASVVRREPRQTERRISMTEIAKSDQSRYRQSLLLLQRPRKRLLRSQKAGAPIPARSKLALIAMLQSPAGATIAAMMDATGWQQHSVRGFLVGVVRKRLKLKLSSKKVDGSRVYQIAAKTAAR